MPGVKGQGRRNVYYIYNPYSHLTKTEQLTSAQWERIKARLTQADLDDIENGGRVRVGKAAKVWKAREAA